MNPSPNEFEELRKLLRWKNSEQPYPGYFNHFSTQVTSRIRAQEMSIRQPSAWMKFLSLFDARPVMATAYALVVFGMMLFAFSFSELEETPVAGGLPPFQAGLVDSFSVAQENNGLHLETRLGNSIAPAYQRLAAEPFFAGSVDEAHFPLGISETGHYFSDASPFSPLGAIRK